MQMYTIWKFYSVKFIEHIRKKTVQKPVVLFFIFFVFVLKSYTVSISISFVLSIWKPKSIDNKQQQDIRSVNRIANILTRIFSFVCFNANRFYS